MGMKFHTDIMGDVTTNIGVISYDKRKSEAVMVLI